MSLQSPALLFSRLRVSRIIAATMAALSASIGHAAVIPWSNASGGGFQDGANWTGGVPPAAGDRSLFDLTSGFTVTFTAGVANERMQVRHGQVDLALAGFTYQLTLTGFPSLQVGIFAGDDANLSMSGGALNIRDAVLGSFTNAQGSAQISGSSASLTANGGLTIADSGVASLTLTGGATVTYSGQCVIGHQPIAAGAVTVTGAGSKLTGAGEMMVAPLNGAPGDSAATRDSIPQGLLDVRSGALVHVPILTLGTRAILTGDARVEAAQLHSAGRIQPGHTGVGRLTCEGAVDLQSGGNLDIEIGGPTPITQHDVLTIQGNAALAGALNLAFLNGYVPPSNLTFTILTATSVTGAFQSLHSSGLPSGRAAIINYLPTSVSVRVDVSSPADINQDGIVNSSDLGLLLGAWGTNDPAADVNRDGVVNSSDLGLLLGYWGAVTP